MTQSRFCRQIPLLNDSTDDTECADSAGKPGFNTCLIHDPTTQTAFKTENIRIPFDGLASRGDPVERFKGEAAMLRHLIFAVVLICSSMVIAETASAQQRAYGQTWGGQASTRDWNRFYHYPYVYYPQNFWGQEYYRSSDSLYHRYPQEMRIPVYNKKWHNYYPSNRRFHSGHHFILDVF